MFEVKIAFLGNFVRWSSTLDVYFLERKVIYEAPVLIQRQIVVKQNVPQGQISSHRANVRKNMYGNHLQE